MPKRIFLVHPTPLAMPAIDEAFKKLWPQAQILNLLDESLYADVPADGAFSESICQRVADLFRHCERSGADGIVFSGSTFGPAVEAAREQVSVPVLRAEEAMMDEAVARGERILVVCTQKRAIPIIRATLDAAVARAGVMRRISELWVTGARDALTSGDNATHDRLIAEQVAAAGDFDVIAFGMPSMAPAREKMPADLARRILTTGEAAVARMRALVDH